MKAEKKNFQMSQSKLYNPIFSESWSQYSLYKLATWINGMAFRNIEFTSSGKPVIKIAEIKNGITSQTKFTNLDYDSVYYITRGDMLFCWSGQPETSIDVFWWNGPDGWLNQHIFKVIPNEICNTQFLYYLLKYIKPHFIKIACNKQTTGLGHVTKKDIQNIIVGIPDKPIQVEIVSILQFIDKKIELLRWQNKTLEKMAQTIFKEWFVNFTVNGEKLKIDKSTGLPEGWRMGKLPDIIEISPKRKLKKGEIATYLEMKGMPTQGHRAEGWCSRKFTSGSKFVNGDTLLARITPCLENGKTAYVDFLSDEKIGWGSTEFIVLRPKTPFHSFCGYLLARNNIFRNYAIGQMTGSSGRQRVPEDSLLNYDIIIPPDEVVIQFGKLIDPFVQRLTLNGEETQTLSKLRDTLLPKLMKGELRVKGFNKLI